MHSLVERERNEFCLKNSLATIATVFDRFKERQFGIIGILIALSMFSFNNSLGSPFDSLPNMKKKFLFFSFRSKEE